MKVILLSIDSDIGNIRKLNLNYNYELYKGNTDLYKCEDYIKEKWNIKYNQPDINKYRAKISHFDNYVKILEKIVFENINNVIVCEDDAILKEGINLEDLEIGIDEPVLLNAELNHPTSWKLDKKDYWIENILSQINKFNDGLNLINYDKFRWSCTACVYYPSWQCAQKLLNFIYQSPTKFTTMDLYLSKNKLIKYLYYPSIFLIKDDKVSQIDKARGCIDNYVVKNKYI